MAQPIQATCPNCYREHQVESLRGGMLWVSDREMVGASVECPDCRTLFDPSGDRTYDPDPDGRFRLREAVYAASLAREPALEAVADILSRPMPRADLEAAIAALQGPLTEPLPPQLEGIHERLNQWTRENPFLAGIVIGVVAGALLSWLQHTIAPEPEPSAPEVSVNVTVESPSPEELERIVDEAVREQIENLQRPGGPATPGTSDP